MSTFSKVGRGYKNGVSEASKGFIVGVTLGLAAPALGAAELGAGAAAAGSGAVGKAREAIVANWKEAALQTTSRLSSTMWVQRGWMSSDQQANTSVWEGRPSR